MDAFLLNCLMANRRDYQSQTNNYFIKNKRSTAYLNININIHSSIRRYILTTIID